MKGSSGNGEVTRLDQRTSAWAIDMKGSVFGTLDRGAVVHADFFETSV